MPNLFAIFRFLDPWRWQDADYDGPFVLKRCRWTGAQQTAVWNIRRLYPGMKPHWHPDGPSGPVFPKRS
jgi:hypothetical protein